MKQKKSTGMGFNMPSESCSGDVHCPFHGEMGVHGRVFSGVVSKRNTHKTVTVEWPRIHFIQKYERYEKKRSKVHAHNPDCMQAKVGDKVTIVETRPISKMKKFVVVRIEE
tara:strand:- start:5825 stop:6157 length:333 start_codon:yes stop_codon:yes gene_type:complete